MKRYSVTVIMTISGTVEVDADSEEEAKEIAAQMDYDEWDEVVIDSTDTPYEPDYLTEVCDHCGNIEGQCVCECCEGCGQVNEDDCECDEDEDEDE